MHLGCCFVDMFSAHLYKKIFAHASDSIASYAVITENKLTVYCI